EYTRALADWRRAERLEWEYPFIFRVRNRVPNAQSELGVLAAAVREWGQCYCQAGHTDTDATDIPSEPNLHERAIAECSKAIAADPLHAVAHCLRGAARWHIGDLGAARADLDEAIRLDPNLAPAHRYRGLVKQATGEHQEAITDLSEAARLDPENPHNHA